MGDGDKGKVGGEDEERSREDALPAEPNLVARHWDKGRRHEAARGHAEGQEEVEDGRRDIALADAFELAQRGKGAIEKGRGRGEDKPEGARRHDSEAIN